VIVGIDPGQRGGIAIIEGANVVFISDMPQLHELVELLEKYKDKMERAFIEKQHTYPKQGVVSQGKLMKHYGELIGVLVALRIPFEEVNPKRWQAFFFGTKRKKQTKKERKKASIAKAKSLFPNVEIGNRDGRAEALLIAEYGRNLIYGGER